MVSSYHSAHIALDRNFRSTTDGKEISGYGHDEVFDVAGHRNQVWFPPDWREDNDADECAEGHAYARQPGAKGLAEVS